MTRVWLFVLLVVSGAWAQTVLIAGREVPYRLVDGRQVVERSALAEVLPELSDGEGDLDLEQLAADPGARVTRRDGKIVSIRFYHPIQAVLYEKPPSQAPEEQQAGGAELPDEALVAEIVNLCNQVRAQHGAGPLKHDAVLASAGRGHSLEMLELGYQGHISPTAGRETPMDRVRLEGILPMGVGENIAGMAGVAAADIPRTSVDGWMNSPPHRENLLNPIFSSVGIGIARKGPRVMITQVLANGI